MENFILKLLYEYFQQFLSCCYWLNVQTFQMFLFSIYLLSIDSL